MREKDSGTNITLAIAMNRLTAEIASNGIYIIYTTTEIEIFNLLIHLFLRSLFSFVFFLCFILS